MQVAFGKHTGKSVELLVLKDPSYIRWILDQLNTYGAMKKVPRPRRNARSEVRRQALRQAVLQ